MLLSASIGVFLLLDYFLGRYLPKPILLTEYALVVFTLTAPLPYMYMFSAFLNPNFPH